MSTTKRPAVVQQQVGGLAALCLAAAYLAAMPFFLVVVQLADAETAAEKVALLAGHHWAVHAMYLVTYVVFGIVLAVLALALNDRLHADAPVLARAAAVTGVMWGVALLASGLIYNAGMAAVVNLQASDPGRAVSLWQAIEPVAAGLGGANGELLGGLWVLLVTMAGLRGALPRRLGWLGLVVGVAGLLSVIPPLQPAAYIFGLLQIVWFAWLGTTLLRTGRSTHAEAPELLTV